MAESIFKIKVSNGLINIELEGKSEIVIEQFNEIRRAGLENFLTGSPIATEKKAVVKDAAPKLEAPVAEKKKRGRKPKVVQLEEIKQPEEIKIEATPAVEEVKAKRGRAKKVATPEPEKQPEAKPERKKRTRKAAISNEATTEVAAVETKKEEEPITSIAAIAPPKAPRGRKAKAVDTIIPEPVVKEKPAKKEKTVKEKVAKEKVAKVKVVKVKEPKRVKVQEPKPAKVAKVKEPRKPKAAGPRKNETAPVEVNLSKMPTLDEVCGSNRPGPEREWILTYALYASEFGKKTITRDDIVQKYAETNRKDQSKINNLTNNISNAIKKGWIENPEDKKLYITAKGTTMAYTIATRTAPVKEKKTGKVPKKLRLDDAADVPMTEEAVETNMAVIVPEVETPQQVAKIAKKAKSKSVKKAKTKKKPVKKATPKKAAPAAEAPVEVEVVTENTPPTEN